MADLPHLRVWPAGDRLQRTMARFLAATEPRLPTDLDPDEVAESAIPRNGGGRISILSLHACGPHVDETHRPWAILGILAAGPSHRIGTSEQHRPEGEPAPDLTAAAITELPVRAGDLVMMSLHHVHWLLGRTEETPLRAITLDRSLPASQVDAESAMLRLLAPYVSDLDEAP
jgi:hypothetical protein